MKIYEFLLLLLCTLSIACSKNVQEPFNKKKIYYNRLAEIVISPPNADPLEKKAATEFNKYYDRIFQIRNTDSKVYIGDFGYKPKDENTLRYYTEGKNLYIVGGNPQSTLYAVYSFFENELGVRFLAPDAELIQRRQKFTLQDWDYSYTPEVLTRTVHSRLFYDHPDFAAKHRVTDEAFPRYVPKARVHTFHKFLPAESFYEDHPEYYALRNGKRRTTQLCLTNEEVFQIVKDSVAIMLEEFPKSDVISVSQDDNTLYCQCDSCEAIHQKEESPAGTMIHFVNRIAKEFPDKQISTLAYQYTRKAPKNIKPEPNVLITLCSIECDRSGTIDDNCVAFNRDLYGWSEVTENIRIWDYTTQFTNFLAPFPNLHTLQPNIVLFRDYKAKWIFEQHSKNPSELFELRSYLTAKLLWEPEVNIDSVRQEFLQGYYGEAAPYVQSYIDKIHAELAKDPKYFLFLYGDPSQAFDSFLSQENLAAYNEIYDKAENKVKADPKILQRVKTARLSVDYASLEYAKKNLRAFTNDNALANKLKNFKELTAKQNITAMNEMGFTVSEYLDQYVHTLERAKNKNIVLGKKVSLLTQAKKYAKEDPQTLTDGAYGGSSFFSNWLGFEGNDLEAVIDLGKARQVSEISTAFLQVTNHIVFFPEEVTFLSSNDGKNYEQIANMQTKNPLSPNSKVNDIEYFKHSFPTTQMRYIKIKAKNISTAPEWHNSSGLPAWIFIDEIELF